ncbi:alpha-amylase family protein [Coraliomargarita sp. W4R72]
MKTSLRFRQIHLDFHTSEAIAPIGSRFDKKAYQDTLKRAEVDSVTTFATCHHGWAYYDTKVGKRHPGLSFDLLRAQYEACKEIGINVPIYLTAGVNNVAADEHPEWRTIDANGSFSGWTDSNIKAGFKMMSFHSPYLNYLCDQIEEVVQLFPEADGIFLDIISQAEDCSQHALTHMKAKGLDPLKPEDRMQSRVDALQKYYQQTTRSAQKSDPNMRIFHNSGHVTPGYRDILKYFSHLELESLPTGGWGYDHFPSSAKYAQKLDHEFLGMTGKFHTTWGEFGGFKHPNALKYECCAMLAFGARCSIGDQLHPTGQLDSSTYDLIGEAYREVAQKEAFVIEIENIADIALLSSESIHAEKSFREETKQKNSDIGANRVLLEEHFLYDIIDSEMDFAAYKMLILPDDIDISSTLKTKIDHYVKNGGKLFITGESGMNAQGQRCFDIGAELGELSEYHPDYLLPIPELQADFVHTPMIMYKKSRRLTVTDGVSLGDVYDPYFNREWNHFCSHQHTPARPEASGFSCGSRKGNVLYLAHPVFTIYRSYGQVALRQYISKALRSLLNDDNSIQLENFPSTGRISLMQQAKESRYVLHLLNANTINRGGASELHGGNLTAEQKSFEVIEDLKPIFDVNVSVQLSADIKTATLQPSGEAIDFTKVDDTVSFNIPKMHHHQMITFEY